MASRFRLQGQVFNPQNLHDLLGSPTSRVAYDMFLRGVRVQNKARRLVRVDTGRLRSSIHVSQYQSHQRTVTRVGSNVIYAPFVGTIYNKRYWRGYLIEALKDAKY